MKNLFIAGVIVTLTAMSAQAEGVVKGGLLSMIKPDASVEYGIKRWTIAREAARL